VIVKTEAIVLKRMNYRDTSRIVRLLTRDFGLISVIAKGARDRRSRLGPLLDSLNHLQVVFYRKAGRDLHLITQCDMVHRYSTLTEDLARLGPAIAILELAGTASRAEEDGQPLFSAVADSLKSIDEGNDPSGVLLRFEMGLLSLLGFRPDFRFCVRCDSPVGPGSGTKTANFRLTTGGIICNPCSRSETAWQEISTSSLEVLVALERSSRGDSAYQITCPQDVYRESRNILRFFLRTHVDGMNNLKSETVFSTLE